MDARTKRRVLVTGATGYLGRALVPRLVERGHDVRALVRDVSRADLPAGVDVVAGDPLVAASFVEHARDRDTLVQLVGTRKPAPWKASSFERVDRTSALAALDVAVAARVSHYVYLSVAQPAPVMRAYVSVRTECERRITASGVAATFVRPWYVIGPGHRWPLVLAPLYAVLERVPATRASAVRLGLVDLDALVATLVDAIEHPPSGVRVVETAEMRALARASPDGALDLRIDP